MIDRKIYLKALDIVEQYHEDIKSLSARHEYKSADALQIGDFVEAVYLSDTMKQYLKEGRLYQVIEKGFYGNRFYIRDNNGRRRVYTSRTKCFKALANWAKIAEAIKKDCIKRAP